MYWVAPQLKTNFDKIKHAWLSARLKLQDRPSVAKMGGWNKVAYQIWLSSVEADLSWNCKIGRVWQKWGEGGSGNPIFLHESSSLVETRLHTEFGRVWLCRSWEKKGSVLVWFCGFLWKIRLTQLWVELSWVRQLIFVFQKTLIDLRAMYEKAYCRASHIFCMNLHVRVRLEGILIINQLGNPPTMAS